MLIQVYKISSKSNTLNMLKLIIIACIYQVNGDKKWTNVIKHNCKSQQKGPFKKQTCKETNLLLSVVRLEPGSKTNPSVLHMRPGT